MVPTATEAKSPGFVTKRASVSVAQCCTANYPALVLQTNNCLLLPPNLGVSWAAWLGFHTSEASVGDPLFLFPWD